MKFVVLKHSQPSKQVPVPRRRYLHLMADAVDKRAGDQPPKGKDIHFDLMLESQEGLLTWAMGCLPLAGKSCGAIKLPLHRAHYLTHEGPVSDGRGTVQRVMAGEYEFSDPQRLLLRFKRETLVVEMAEIQPDHFRFSFFSNEKVG